MEIMFIGIFLRRGLRRNWEHPRLRLNTLASTEMHQFWVALTRVHYFGLRASRLLRCTARYVVRHRSFSYRTITTISTTTKRRMRPSPSHPTISCCNPQGPRSAFGTQNFCLIRIDRQDFQDQTARTNHRFVLPVYPKALAPCVM